MSQPDYPETVRCPECTHPYNPDSLTALQREQMTVCPWCNSVDGSNASAVYMQIVKQTHEEKVAMYMKNCTKKQLAEMLTNYNEIFDARPPKTTANAGEQHERSDT